MRRFRITYTRIWERVAEVNAEGLLQASETAYLSPEKLDWENREILENWQVEEIPAEQPQ